MDYYIITEGEHKGTIFSMILSRCVILFSNTIEPYTLLADLPDDVRKNIRFERFDSKHRN